MSRRYFEGMIPALPDNFDIPKEFPIAAHWAFFNHAGVAPIAARAAAALRTYADQAQRDAYIGGKWYTQAERVRRLAAKLINADPREIAFIKNTSEGLAFVANGLDWRAGDEIITTNVEYPANIYPWTDAAQRFNARHVMVAERNADGVGRIDADDILNAVTSRTRLIALSHVEYASGFRNDLAKIGAFCRTHNILFCVDAIQTCGVCPVDVRAMNIDFLSADGHKWLLGPEGLGFFFCDERLLTQLRPEIGWMNVINATDYGNYDFTLRPDAKRFECGTYNIPGVLALGGALEVLDEVGLPLVWARVKALTDQLALGLQAKGYALFSSRAEHESSGIVSFTSPRHDHAQIVTDLEKQRIIIVTREKRLRASPHFYNTPAQIDQLLNALPDH